MEDKKKITDIPVLEIGDVCPNCGSRQFSVSSFPETSDSTDFPPNVFGIGDCRDCQQEFFIKLAPELSNAFEKNLERFKEEIWSKIKKEIIKTIFHY